MRKIISRAGLVVLVTGLILMGASRPIFAQTEWKGACVSGDSKEDVATIQGISCLLANVLSVVMTLLAFTGFVMFVWAAFNLLISGGQPSHLEKAKKTIVYAVGGLVLAISSFVILNIIGTVTGYVTTSDGENADITKIKFLPNDPGSSST
jgi:hypothetical protein